MAKGRKPPPRTKAAVRSRRTPAPEPRLPPASGPLAVVGIGASAGGPDAISRLLSALPADTGMAFVIVPQLSPNHQSMMAEILSHNTAIPVLRVKDEPAVLSTVNEELHNRNLELATTNNDLVNLRASVELAIVMFGADLRIRRFTPAAEQLLNLIPDDIGRPIGHVKLNVELPDFESLVRRVITSATPEQREGRDAAGHWFSVRVRPYRALDNRIDGAVVELVDIDSIKRAADTVHESEARFRLLADSAPVLIWVDDADGDRFANHAYLEFVGTSASGVRAGRWHEFIHPDDRACYLATYADAAARNVGFEMQVRFHRSDGQYRWMKSIATPRNARAFAGFVGSKTDITDLKDAELALVNTDRSKDEFLAILSHELRNPLAPLHNVVQLLRADDRDTETTTWALDTLDRQIHTLTLLVNDLLDISRISHGKINLRREPTDLVAVLRGAAAAAERSATEAGQSLSVQVPDHPVQMVADALRLEQVFGNLLNNATKFTPEGGHVWLAARELPESAGVEVSIRDDGAGISAELLPTIFELFRQGDRATERLQGGLGVGLTVARRLVQLHGGSVEARSDGPGCGSEFVVRLPVIPGRHSSVPAG